MSMERARAHLQKLGLADKIREFSVSSATVELAAAAVGCERNRIAKTLSFSDGDGVLLLVTAGDARIDNAKFKAAFHEKPRMPAPEIVEEKVGHAVGGVCPFGIREGVRVFLDESLKRFDRVYPACGSDNSAVEMTIAQLEEASGFERWVDVCKNWEKLEISS